MQGLNVDAGHTGGDAEEHARIVELSKATSQPTSDAASKSPETKTAKSSNNSSQGVMRETLESIAFAFVLALLFRTFVAEAFVIPTGSMAPTLYGRNKDVTCPACQHQYAIGASDELDDETGTYLIPSRRIEQSMCPNCRHMHDVKSLPVFTGDRILVNKAAYRLQNPTRWDVIVFRYPEDTQKNYIKRLVGLPGETIRVERGDVYARRGEGGEFKILRKDDPNKQKLLQQVVYNDTQPPTALLEHGWPEAWQSESPEADGGWKHVPLSREFHLASSPTPKTVRYSHLVPTLPDWSAADEGKQPNPNPRPQLVSDFCGYNAYTGGRSSGIDDDRFWVGDLTLSCTLNVASVTGDDGTFTLELNEGVRRYRCHINVSTGVARLTRTDELAGDPAAADIELAKAQTSIKGAGTYNLRFANVDDRLCLWVNDSWINSGLVPFGSGAEFDAPSNRRPQDADLRPAAFSGKDIVAVVSNLLIERDIYYRAERVADDAGMYSSPSHEVDEVLGLREALNDPQQWGEIYEKNSNKAEFGQLGPDEFFVMGDNSPRSQDSRLWPNQVRHAHNRHAVERQALIGKAFFIYWPHGVPFLKNGNGFKIIGHKPVPRDIHDQFQQQQFAQDRDEAWAYPKYSAPFYPQWWRWKRIR